MTKYTPETNAASGAPEPSTTPLATPVLSDRAQRWATVGFSRGPSDHYHPETNPHGALPLDMSDNWFVKGLLSDYVNKNVRFEQAHFSYNQGFTGTERLCKATAELFDEHFNPTCPIDPQNFTFCSGATSLNELCAMMLCDPDCGQALLLPAPNYGAFNRDFLMRTGITLEHAYFDDQTDQFSEDCVAVLESALDNAQARGVHVKGLVICNPSNPLGQCYTRDALVGILELCDRRNLHLVSDEIYALSVYEAPDGRQSERFCSVLGREVDLARRIDPDQVHVLYGFAKDFGSPGLRLGCLYSSNTVLSKALRACCRFASPSQLSMHVVASILEDGDFLTAFLRQSQRELGQARVRAERLLEAAAIPFNRKGNAGLFLWLDLQCFLRPDDFDGDGWRAHRDLSRVLDESGVLLSNGETYHSPKPGAFRMVFSVPEYFVKEAVKRMTKVLDGHKPGARGTSTS